MGQPQQVIVFSNPLSAMFWQTMMNGGLTVFFAVVMLGIMWAVIYSYASSPFEWWASIRKQPAALYLRASWMHKVRMWSASIVVLLVAAFLIWM